MLEGDAVANATVLQRLLQLTPFDGAESIGFRASCQEGVPPSLKGLPRAVNEIETASLL